MMRPGQGPRALRGVTLIELTLAFGLLAFAAACLVQTLVIATARRERLRRKQIARAELAARAEEILRFAGSSAQLKQAYHAPPETVILDGDGDTVFDSGWARVILRRPVPSLTGEREEMVQLVLGKAE
jgi:type II secretory pathway pseudopilin PulG